jgi:hypothetical protein
MKKVLLVVLGIVLTYGVINAQVRFGIKAGGTLSNVTLKDEEGTSKSGVKFGFELGGLLEYSFSESLSLQPELLFVNNGSEDKEEEGKATLSFNQLQVPINLKYKMGTEQLKFYAAAGPYFGYIFSAKAKYSEDGMSGSIDLFDKDIVDPMKHLDFGIGVGFGLELSNKYLVGVGYKYGIANLAPKDSDGTMKVGTFNLSVGFLF